MSNIEENDDDEFFGTYVADECILKLDDQTDDDDETISFEDLGLDEITLQAIEKKGFITPSPIQVLAIPRLLSGDANVIAKARTGTGKTAAFGLPLVQNLREKKDYVRAIILEPTRELAMQTAQEMASFTTGSYPKSCVVYGGASIGEQIRNLKRGCDIVVGTPGRVQDLIDREVLDISKIEYFILDEGDEMLDMGFVEDIEKIFSSANQECRVLLFSATVPSEILKIAQQFMGEYEIVEEEGFEEEPLLIDQKYWIVRGNEKTEALVRLIDISPDFFGLVFVQRKSDADIVSKALDEKGYQVAALHGDIPQGQREKILTRFRIKKTRILVATDVAARGIDIEGITHVVNYDMPFDSATYVHRIGRTGRAGSSGIAVTFVCPSERRKLIYLKNAIKRNAKGMLNEEKIPSIEQVLNAKQSRLFDEIKSRLNGEQEIPEGEKPQTIFDSLAEELCQGKNAQEIVSSLLELTYGKDLNKKRYGKINAVQSFDADEKSRGRSRRNSISVGENEIRIYVQLGWHDGYNPKKIAEFFSNLLHIPGRKVDAIDMSDKFSLVTLPKKDGIKALELSEKDRKIPHMHQDTKVQFSGRKEGADFASRKSRNNPRTRFEEKSRSPAESYRKNKGKSEAQKHTSTSRNSKKKDGR